MPIIMVIYFVEELDQFKKIFSYKICRLCLVKMHPFNGRIFCSENDKNPKKDPFSLIK